MVHALVHYSYIAYKNIVTILFPTAGPHAHDNHNIGDESRYKGHMDDNIYMNCIHYTVNIATLLISNYQYVLNSIILLSFIMLINVLIVT